MKYYVIKKALNWVIVAGLDQSIVWVFSRLNYNTGEVFQLIADVGRLKRRDHFQHSYKGLPLPVLALS